MVNRTFNTTLTERLQHLQQGKFVEMTEWEREKRNAKSKNLDMNNLQSNLLKQHWAQLLQARTCNNFITIQKVGLLKS